MVVRHPFSQISEFQFKLGDVAPFHIFVYFFMFNPTIPSCEVKGDWWKLHNEELHKLNSPPNIIRMIKSRV
jgi:hypothetical protein